MAQPHTAHPQPAPVLCPVPQFPHGSRLHPWCAAHGAELITGCRGHPWSRRPGQAPHPCRWHPARHQPLFTPPGAHPAPAVPAAWSQACPCPARPAPGASAAGTASASPLLLTAQLGPGDFSLRCWKRIRSLRRAEPGRSHARSPGFGSQVSSVRPQSAPWRLLPWLPQGDSGSRKRCFSCDPPTLGFVRSMWSELFHCKPLWRTQIGNWRHLLASPTSAEPLSQTLIPSPCLPMTSLHCWLQVSPCPEPPRTAGLSIPASRASLNIQPQCPCTMSIPALPATASLNIQLVHPHTTSIPALPATITLHAGMLCLGTAGTASFCPVWWEKAHVFRTYQMPSRTNKSHAGTLTTKPITELEELISCDPAEHQASPPSWGWRWQLHPTCPAWPGVALPHTQWVHVGALQMLGVSPKTETQRGDVFCRNLPSCRPCTPRHVRCSHPHPAPPGKPAASDAVSQ